MAPQDREDGGVSGHRMSSSSNSQRCSHCDSHYYCHHLDDRQKHFFKVMVGDFRQELTVPAKFARNFRGQIPQVVKVEAPDGNLHSVNVSQDLNKLVFRYGWGAFCSAYELKQGDVLVFRYTGDSRFKVLIFDPSGCEKENFHVAMNPAGGNVQHTGVPQEQSPSGEGLARRRTGELRHSRKASKIGSADSPPQRSARDLPFPEENTTNAMDSGGLQTPPASASRAVLAKGCNLTTEQKARLESFEKNIRTGIPLYVANTNGTTLSDGYLVICKDYSDKYLPHEDQTITLRHPPGSKKKREANFKVSSDCAYIFSAGWPGFVRDTKLQEGDACAFEASMTERRVTVTVHPLQGSCSPPELGASQPPRRVIHPGYVGTKQMNLTPEQKKKVEEKLREIQPETPLFLSVKRGSDTMCFSREFAVEHLPWVSQMVRLRRAGVSCSWEAELKVRNGGKVHQLCRGWKQFADDNALRQGDIFLFQLPAAAGDQDGGALVMNVHILRDRPLQKS